MRLKLKITLVGNNFFLELHILLFLTHIYRKYKRGTLVV